MVLSKNANLWKQQPGTIFVMTDDVFESTQSSRFTQLRDDRNSETVEKIASFHVVPNDVVTAQELYDSGGLVTAGGVIQVHRGTSGGGLFGGGAEDGSVVVGGGNSATGGKVLQSYLLTPTCMVHEVSTFVSPAILWRYLDQLRIPGT
jgi:Fasciclin domain